MERMLSLEMKNKVLVILLRSERCRAFLTNLRRDWVFVVNIKVVDLVVSFPTNIGASPLDKRNSSYDSFRKRRIRKNSFRKRRIRLNRFRNPGRRIHRNRAYFVLECRNGTGIVSLVFSYG